ncbi:MAG: cyclic nucleotide-binding domain-containing protein [Pseudobutyrivibrio sp.]|nr:cyclic nucleotide-binding domain-containing protein [Pseudobutyrivibrio sp.]
MEITKEAKGKKIIKAGEKVTRMYVVYSGSVDQEWKGSHITLGPGTVVGLSDALNETYESTYVTLEEVSLFPCEYNSMADLYKIFEENPVFIFGYAKGAFRQCRDVFVQYDEIMDQVYHFYKSCHDYYREYAKKCKASGTIAKKLILLEDMEQLELEDTIRSWEHDYIDCLNSIDNKNIESIYGKEIPVVAGVIGTCCGYMTRAMNCVEMAGFYLEEFTPILISDSELDLFNDLFELQVFCVQRDIACDDVVAQLESIYNWASESGLYDKALLKRRWDAYKNHDFAKDVAEFQHNQNLAQAQMDDCLGHICEFGGIDEEQTEKYRQIIQDYLALPDREDREDKARRIRKKAVDAFYEIYEKVFFASLQKPERSDVLEMFLNFGFIDYDAVGQEITTGLRDVVNDRLISCQTDHVFTIYTWLLAIYNGDREPSRNELDLDYRGFVLEERKSGNIPENKVNEYMNNQDEKVKFEIHNFFMSANRTTSGKMTAFCPVLAMEDFAASPDRMLLTAERLQEAIARIESIDFGIFYREEYFVDQAAGIKSEMYMKKVVPDIILLPNCGMRAMLWQECGGLKVDTPGRMVFPIFTLEDIDKLMIACCGAFRWEVCRKENGSRWNDIQANCLTSDFYDYFTFYRKNRDLSAEHKEKIKILLKSSRNNMREAFTRQYIIWVNFESQGSVRLNKVERELMAKYCPFAKQYRKAVAAHPLFEASITRYNTKTAQALHHLHAVFDKYEKQTGSMPEEIAECIEFYNM